LTAMWNTTISFDALHVKTGTADVIGIAARSTKVLNRHQTLEGASLGLKTFRTIWAHRFRYGVALANGPLIWVFWSRARGTGTKAASTLFFDARDDVI
jgi:hypothetical protein